MEVPLRIKQGIIDDFRSPAHRKDHVVVPPHFIREDDRITRIHPHVRDDTHAMGEGVRDHRQTYVLSSEGRVLFENLILPCRTKRHDPERGGIGERLPWSQSVDHRHDRRQVHGTAFFHGHTYGGIVFVGPFFGFRALSQNSLGKEKVFAHL